MKKRKMEERISLFVNRKKELTELAGSDRHVVVVGYRRMGKTHIIIKHLLQTWQKKRVPVYLDMLYFSSWEEFADSLVKEFLSTYDETADDRLSLFFETILSSVSSALSSVKEIEGRLGAGGVKFFSLRLAFNEKKKSELELLKAALDFISEFAGKKGLRATIALDEVQAIKDYDSMEQGLAILRGELQFAKNVQLIMSGSLPSFIHSQILEKSKPFWKQLKIMEIGPFEIGAVREAASAMGVEARYCKEIFDLTKGVPDYVIKVLKNMKEAGKVNTAFDQTVREEELFFSSVISSLSKAEHTAIGRIAKGESYNKIEQALGYPPTAVLNSLIAKGLIRRIAKGAYGIVDPGLEYILGH